MADKAEVEQAEPKTLDLEETVRLLRTIFGVGNAYVEHTGGGVATIYAGNTFRDPQGGDWDVYAGIAGPGWFEGPTQGRASAGEFHVGPNDQGEASAWTLPHDADEMFAARLIAVQARTDNRKATVAELESAGFTMCPGTGTALDAVGQAWHGTSGTCATCGAEYLRGGTDGVAEPHLRRLLGKEPLRETLASEVVLTLLALIAKHGDRPVRGFDRGVDKDFRGVFVDGFDPDGDPGENIKPAFVIVLTESPRYRQDEYRREIESN